MTRATFFQLHSWLGVVTAAFVLAVTWTGSLVVFNDEIDWLLNPAVRADPSAPARPFDDVVTAVQARHSGLRIAVHRQISPRWAHTAYVYDGRQQRFLQIDPSTARITFDRAMDGYTFNVGYFLRQLHVRLLMGYWGRVLVGVIGVTLVLSALSSLGVYREWMRSLFRVRRERGLRIFYMDIHKAVGLWTLVFTVMFGATGAVLGLENLYYRIWPPSPPRTVTFTETTPLARPLSVGEALGRVSPNDSAFRMTSVEVAPGQPVVVRGNHPGLLIAEGASEFRVSTVTGEVVVALDARRAPWAEYLYNTLDPLHFGYFGEPWGLVPGYAVEIVWALAGLAPGVLAITGTWMWWLRRRRREAIAAAAATTAASL